MAVKLGNARIPTGTGTFGGPSKAPAPATADRNTRIRFDTPRKVIIEPAFVATYQYTDIVLGAGDAINVHKVEGIGIQLRPRQKRSAQMRERTDMQDAILKPVGEGGILTVPSKMAGLNLVRSASEIPGATTGAHANLASEGDRHYQMQYTAGENITGSAYRVSADQTAYPGPNTAEDTYVMDRIVVGTTVHPFDQGVYFEFIAPGGEASTTTTLLTVYFSGPASYTRQVVTIDGSQKVVESIGTGQYALKLYGDGDALLFERVGYYWNGVLQGSIDWSCTDLPILKWAPPNQIYGKRHVVYVQSVKYTHARDGKGGTIYIATGHAASDSGGLLKLGSSQSSVARAAGMDSIYLSKRVGIRRDRQADTPTSEVPLRIDAARGTRPIIQVSKAKYETTGYFWAGPFPIHTLNLAVQPDLTISVFGDVPTGATMTLRLYEADRSTEIPGVTLYSNNWGIQRGFTNRTNLQHFWIKVEMTGTGWVTPTAKYIEVSKESVIDDGQFTEFRGGIDQEVSISGPESDPSHASATVTIQDPTADFQTKLFHRENVNCIIDTEYTGVDWTNPANEGRQSVLFLGWTNDSPSIHEETDIRKLDGTAMAWPTENWRKYEISLLGEHYRASWSHLPINYDFAIDPSTYSGLFTPVPWKVTDVIRLCLLWMGYDDDEVDIPDLPVRLFPRQADKPVVISSGSNLIEFVQKLTLDYLGYILWHDANSGVGATPANWRGKWRLRPPTTPPYTPLAYFTRSGPGGTGLRLPHMLGAYPMIGSAVGAPVIGKPKEWKKALETNHLIVGGVADMGVQEDNPYAIVQRKINYKSYSPDPLNPTADPTHPDFLGMPKVGWYVDYNLSTPDAVNWVLNRLYDVAAHTIRGLLLVAPLVLVTDPADTHQKRPRPLAFYDPVTYEGETYLVRSCNPYWSKVYEQMMLLEIEKPREPYTLY